MPASNALEAIVLPISFADSILLLSSLLSFSFDEAETITFDPLDSIS